jgi:GNAT superfamily N-acetyltransferase
MVWHPPPRRAGPVGADLGRSVGTDCTGLRDDGHSVPRPGDGPTVTGAGGAPSVGGVTVTCAWRGDFDNAEVNGLHAEAFETRVFDESEWDWQRLVGQHSLGWVTARVDDRLVGFVNVVWDGLVHAWLQDVMVAADLRGRGVGTRLVDVAASSARAAGCEWLHVDFDDHLRPFYLDACGFTPTSAGLMALQPGAEGGALP